MNDLTHLRADFKLRYAGAVRTRASLRHLETVIESLHMALSRHASQLIRPENNYWAALSNAMAGAVEETRAILEDALFVTQLHPIARIFSYFCLGMGLDADVEEIRDVFLQIKKAIIVSENLDDLEKKRNLLRQVSSLGFTATQHRLQKVLSKIHEEPYAVRSIDLDSEYELIKSGVEFSIADEQTKSLLSH